MWCCWSGFRSSHSKCSGLIHTKNVLLFTKQMEVSLCAFYKVMLLFTNSDRSDLAYHIDFLWPKSYSLYHGYMPQVLYISQNRSFILKTDIHTILAWKLNLMPYIKSAVHVCTLPDRAKLPDISCTGSLFSPVLPTALLSLHTLHHGPHGSTLKPMQSQDRIFVYFL